MSSYISIHLHCDTPSSSALGSIFNLSRLSEITANVYLCFETWCLVINAWSLMDANPRLWRRWPHFGSNKSTQESISECLKNERLLKRYLSVSVRFYCF